MSEIKVGDTVRIKNNYPYTSRGNDHGVEFKVTAVHNVRNDDSEFFVEGDPRGSGLWEEFIEKVEPDARWRYNDHIVVYPQADNAIQGRSAVVLDENKPKVYQRWENSIAHPEGEITEAARAYWAAHPKPKPSNYEEVKALATGTVFQFDDGIPWVRVNGGVVDSAGGAKVALPEIWKSYNFTITVIYPKDAE